MSITLIHEGGLQFTATDQSGDGDPHRVTLDAAPAVGGEGQGFRPMELLLVALASCTSIDTLLILNKSKKPYHDYRVTVEGKRREEIPKFFTEINMRFSLESEQIPMDIFHRAVSLSLTKYCSVAESLRPDTMIQAHLQLNGEWDKRVIVKKGSD